MQFALLVRTTLNGTGQNWAPRQEAVTLQGFSTDCTAEEVHYFVSHSDARFVVAHDQEQVDKVLQILDRLPNVEKIIYWDSKGLWFYEHPKLMGFEDVVALGNEENQRSPGRIERSIDKGRDDDLVIVCVHEWHYRKAQRRHDLAPEFH